MQRQKVIEIMVELYNKNCVSLKQSDRADIELNINNITNVIVIKIIIMCIFGNRHFIKSQVTSSEIEFVNTSQ